MKLGQESFPVYKDGQGCIICGSAPSLLEEFAEARKHMPDAVVIAVNEAAHGVHADHLVTLHWDKMAFFKQRSLNKNILGHAAEKPKNATHIDYYWNDAHTQGTSGMAAMLVALHMGFKNIVLCGLPLAPGGGYFNNDTTMKTKPGEPRFGYIKPDAKLGNVHRTGFMTSLTYFPKLKEITRSMSGWTRDVLGGPQWQQT